MSANPATLVPRVIRLEPDLWDLVLAEGARRFSSRNYTEALRSILSDHLKNSSPQGGDGDGKGK